MRIHFGVRCDSSELQPHASIGFQKSSTYKDKHNKKINIEIIGLLYGFLRKDLHIVNNKILNQNLIID